MHARYRDDEADTRAHKGDGWVDLISLVYQEMLGELIVSINVGTLEPSVYAMVRSAARDDNLKTVRVRNLNGKVVSAR